MEIKIFINGSGFSISTGLFHDNDIKKIKQYCKTNNLPMHNYLSALFYENYDETETLDNDGDWACNNISEYYGPDFHQCEIFVVNENNRRQKVNLSPKQFLIEKVEVTTSIFENEVGKNVDKVSFITFVSKENGALKTGIIEIKNNQTWDSNKLKIYVKRIMGYNFNYWIMTKIFYDGVEIEDLGPEGTESNGFEYHITPISN
jgi:hypothetical protein